MFGSYRESIHIVFECRELHRLRLERMGWLYKLLHPGVVRLHRDGIFVLTALANTLQREWDRAEAEFAVLYLKSEENFDA